MLRFFFNQYVLNNYRTGKEIRMYSQQRLIEKELNIAQKTNFDGWLKGYKKELLPNFVFQLVNSITKIMIYGFAVMSSEI